MVGAVKWLRISLDWQPAVQARCPFKQVPKASCRPTYTSTRLLAWSEATKAMLDVSELAVRWSNLLPALFFVVYLL
jgi:hypothetical protein